MSKKNLLNEATIRRFMKLANMEPLTSPFVGRLNEMGAYSDDEEELQEDDAADDDWGGDKGDESEDDPGHVDYEGDEGATPEVEVDALEDEPVGEDAALEPEVRARVEDALAGALEALAAELGDTLGVELDVETAPEEEEMEVDVEAGEVELPGGGEEEVVDVEAGAEVEADEEELALEGVEVVDDSALINEVAKRVTARLAKALAAKK